jgi:hypothetical protein
MGRAFSPDRPLSFITTQAVGLGWYDPALSVLLMFALNEKEAGPKPRLFHSYRTKLGRAGFRLRNLGRDLAPA